MIPACSMSRWSGSGKPRASGDDPEATLKDIKFIL